MDYINYENSLRESGVIPSVRNSDELKSREYQNIKRDTGIPVSPQGVRTAYFTHLCERTRLSGGEPECNQYTADHTFFMLAYKLFNTPFNYVLPMDENRLLDGASVRYWFENIGSSFTDYSGIEDKPVSVLEVLVALADRMDRDLMQGIEPVDRSVKWFWLMLNNLGLNRFTDAKWNIDVELETENILQNWMYRLFDEYGNGSIFPLKSCPEDVRNVEIWHQMGYYVQENYATLNL